MPQLAELVRKLLRTQALQAASRQLAAVPAAAAAATGADAAAGAASQQSQAWELDLSGHAVEYACVVVQFVSSVCIFAGMLAASPPGSACAAMAGALLGELAQALADSCVMEHAARALLYLQARPAPEALLARTSFSGAASLWATAAVSLVRAASICRGDDGPLLNYTAAVQLHGVLSGNCLQHAALAFGLATLSAADGGSTHNSSQAHLAAVSAAVQRSHADSGGPTTRDAAGAPAGSGAARRVLSHRDTTRLQAVMRLTSFRAPGAWPPGLRAGILSVCLRIGWLAVASVQQAAEGRITPVPGGGSRGGDGGGGGTAAASAGDGGGGGSSDAASGGAGGASGRSGEASVRIALEPDCVAEVLLPALRHAWLLLLPTSAAPRWAAGVAEWWRLAVAVGRVAPRCVHDGHELNTLGRYLSWTTSWDLGLAGGVSLLPTRPPPDLAGALAAGFLPFLESLLRHAGQTRWGPEAAIVVGMFEKGPVIVWLMLAPLLAYGEPRQAAALVVTVGKLLRWTDPRVTTGPRAPVDSAAQAFISVACSVLSAAAATMDLKDAAGIAASPATRQLLSMLSLALCLWLPPLAQIGLQAAQLLSPAPLMPEWRPSTLAPVLDALLECLPLLAARCAAGGSAAAAPAAPPAALAASPAAAAAVVAPGVEGSAADSGWRALLLEDVGAVKLLGRMLLLASHLESSDAPAEEVKGFLERTALCCCAVTALCGRERGLAVCVDLTDSAASAGAEGLEGSGAGKGEGQGVAGAAVPGSGGAASAADSMPARTCGRSGVAAVLPPVSQLPWQPRCLRSIASQLESLGTPRFVPTLHALVGLLSRGADAASDAAAADTLREAQAGLELPLVQVLPPPTQARRLLRTCANPGCMNLEGDSELELTLRGCSGCGAVGYCSRPCQTAHWRAGHKEACERRAA